MTESSIIRTDEEGIATKQGKPREKSVSISTVRTDADSPKRLANINTPVNRVGNPVMENPRVGEGIEGVEFGMKPHYLSTTCGRLTLIQRLLQQIGPF
jgi:5-hydroxyisourate hydrolase-like protein (transthyretin family)